jgi:hypothetical protein
MGMRARHLSLDELYLWNATRVGRVPMSPYNFL